MSDFKAIRRALELAIDLAEAQQAEMAAAGQDHEAAAQDVADTRAALDAFNRLAAEMEALRRDAQRYRFIRNQRSVREGD